MKVVDLITNYVVEESNVTLNIVIGEAQIGSSIVKLGNNIIGQGDIQNLDLGSGPTIKGKELKTKSVVADVNDNTNKTSIKYTFSGGQIDQDFISKATVDEDGDSIIYRSLIKFI